jgi:hypothetical protein
MVCGSSITAPHSPVRSEDHSLIDVMPLRLEFGDRSGRDVGEQSDGALYDHRLEALSDAMSDSASRGL